MQISRSILNSSVLSALALCASAQAAPLTVTRVVPQQEQSIASAHWTRERIGAATALAMPVDRGLSGPVAVALREPASHLPARMEPAGKPDANAAEIARSAYWQDWAALEQGAAEAPTDATELMRGGGQAPLGTANVFTSYDVNTQTALWKISPHTWDGKLTFTTSGGGSSCSATVISANNIVTAAHCVYDSSANQFYSNWVFTPAYRNGNAPYGTFAATACTVLTAWVNLGGAFSINTWTRHDVAVCKMGNNSAGQTLNGAVGWAGRLWNAGTSQLVFNSGYPAENYTGATIAQGPAQYLRACTAETFQQTTETLGGGCEWGRGISGGSWMVGYKPFVVSGQVNSVNSGLYIGQSNIYGARFNSSNIETLCNAVGC